MSWVDQVAWKNTFILDKEFDEWVYIQAVEQTYTSKHGSYGTFIPKGKESYERKDKKEC